MCKRGRGVGSAGIIRRNENHGRSVQPTVVDRIPRDGRLLNGRGNALEPETTATAAHLLPGCAKLRAIVGKDTVFNIKATIQVLEVSKGCAAAADGATVDRAVAASRGVGDHGHASQRNVGIIGLHCATFGHCRTAGRITTSATLCQVAPDICIRYRRLSVLKIEGAAEGTPRVAIWSISA